MVGRAALGLSWVRFEEPSADAVERLRRDFKVAVVQDRPADLHVDRTGPVDPGVSELMRNLSARGLI